MRYLYKTLVLFLVALSTNAQVRTINDGAIIKVSPTANIKAVNGSITNVNSGQINNDGNIYLDLDYTQNTAADYAGGNTSWLWFEGNINQNIIADAPVNITRLRVDNGNRVVLGNQVHVQQNLDLTYNGHVELGIHNLIMSPIATINNYNVNNYIITNSTGILQQQVANANIVFPVGNTSYNPATLNNSGVIDDFQVRVFDQVLEEGTTGTIQTSGVVNRTWMIDEVNLRGSNVEVTLQWQTADELAFDRNNCGVAHHLGGTIWDNPPIYTNATSVSPNTWSRARSGFNSFSPFVVRDRVALLPVDLLLFEAKRKDRNDVQLTWVTNSEINCQGFDIERMLDNETDFVKIGWVDGQGTTINSTYYEELDDNNFEGISYYRLKQMNLDGTYSYSEIKAVEGIQAESIIRIFPNPTSDILNIDLTSEATYVQIKIYDSKGALVLDAQQEMNNNQLIQIHHLGRWADGVYLLRLTTDSNQVYIRKFVKE
jgi:acetyltransferase-like isoleucine patch superfamily enzyme